MAIRCDISHRVNLSFLDSWLQPPFFISKPQFVDWMNWLASVTQVDQYRICHKRQGGRSFQSHMYDVSVHSSWAGFTCLYVYSLMTIFLFRLMLETKDLEKGKWQDNRYWVHPEMTLSSPTFDVLDFEKPWLVYRLEEESQQQSKRRPNLGRR